MVSQTLWLTGISTGGGNDGVARGRYFVSRYWRMRDRGERKREREREREGERERERERERKRERERDNNKWRER